MSCDIKNGAEVDLTNKIYIWAVLGLYFRP